MNRRIVFYVLGRIMIVTAALMIPSVVVALLYGEGWTGVYPFLVTISVMVLVGWVLSYRRPDDMTYYMKEGFAIVGLTWIVLSLTGALPYYISGRIPKFYDAFFETASGFTTTGASILPDIEALPHSLLFWRSFSLMIGGMGILVFALAVMPRTESKEVYVMRAEMPGPTFGKLRSKVRSTARVLYVIYIAMMLVLVILLLVGGMSLFDAFIHAFGTAGTGGFSSKAMSVAAYNSTYIEVVLGIAMLVFGTNFSLIYLILKGRAKEAFKSEELRWYLAIIAVAVVAISINLRNVYESVGILFRDVFFTVASVITTTGYAVVDFTYWPLFSRLVLLLLMFVGSMACSTAGGFKVSRVAIYCKMFIREIRCSINPNRVLPLRFEGKQLSKPILRQVTNYLILYAALFTTFTLVVAIDVNNFESAFSAVAATFNNIGPGLGLVGPAHNYSFLTPFSKVVLSFAMIMGRLEILPMIVLFSPSTWRKV
ncbi:MAG TPA: TrkH family potassium uptake protein [Clostridiaceae bacterium]|nr:TrkH family potassium uptake protein [Clostridiaceae bacterium]